MTPPPAPATRVPVAPSSNRTPAGDGARTPPTPHMRGPV
jgi:hypothetical protein